MHFDKGGIYGLLAGAFAAMLATAFGYSDAVLGGIAGGVAWLEKHDKLAGWAQAFGAVMAIAAGFGVAVWQHAASERAQRKSQAERRVQGHQAALDIGGHAQQVLHSAATIFADPFGVPPIDGAELMAKRIDGVVWQIDRSDLSEVRRLEILASVVQLRMLLLQASASLRDIHGGRGVLAKRLERSESLIKELAPAADQVLTTLNRDVAAELGHTVLLELAKPEDAAAHRSTSLGAGAVSSITETP